MLNVCFKPLLVVIFIMLFTFQAYTQSNTSAYKEELGKVEGKLREGNLPGALEIIDNILLNDPKAAEVFYAKALLLGQVGNIDLAIDNANKAYELEPSVLYANYLIELYKSKKDVVKTIDLLQDAQSRFPDYTSLSRELIVNLGFADKLEEALLVYNKEVTKGFHSDTLDVALADVYYHSGKVKEAIALLQPWVGKSTLTSLYGRLGYGFMQEKKYKSAISLLEEGILKTDDDILYLDLADAYRLDGKPKMTFEVLDKAFKSDKVDYLHKYRVMLDLLGPNMTTLNNDQIQSLANTLVLVHPRIAESHMIKGEILWKRGNTAEAKSLFLTAVGIAPNQIDGWRMLINVDLAMKDVDSAIKHSKEALAANPGNPALLYFAGLSYLVKEDTNSAREALEAGLNNSVNENAYLQSMIYGALGDVYHKLEMDAASDVAYEEAIKLDSTNTMAMNNLAYYLSLRKKDLEKAAKYSFKSIELEPNTPTFQDTYAWVLFQQGNYTESLKWIEKALKGSKGDNAVLVEHYGDVLSQLGKTKEALKQWHKALLQTVKPEERAKIEEKIKLKKYVE